MVSSSVWVDYDNDGKLDLVVAGGGCHSSLSPGTSRWLTNEGGWTVRQ